MKTLFVALNAKYIHTNLAVRYMQDVYKRQDVGSTTIKCVVLDEKEHICFESYERHYSQITEKMAALLTKIKNEVVKDQPVQLAVSGSAGMGIAQECNLPFVQEVYATRTATKKLIPDADVIIELGGEDAKILLVSGHTEVRMNGSCAGGTGAFNDQKMCIRDSI